MQTRHPHPAKKNPYRIVQVPAANADPGIQPIGTKVLVLSDVIEQKTEGGIWLPDNTVDTQELAAVTGTLVGKGELAFTGDYACTESEAPKLQQRVVFARYAGILMDGFDGNKYRLCQDSEIAGVIKK